VSTLAMCLDWIARPKPLAVGRQQNEAPPFPYKTSRVLHVCVWEKGHGRDWAWTILRSPPSGRGFQSLSQRNVAIPVTRGRRRKRTVLAVVFGMGTRW
jgi:hypothetical protein